MSFLWYGGSDAFPLDYLDTESEMRRWDGDVSPPHGTRSNCEMIFCWGLSRLKYYFHYEKGWLLNRENGRATLIQEGRYTLFRWTFLYTDWIKSTTRQKRWKLISLLVNRHPNCNNTSEKVWNCPRRRRLNKSRLIFWHYSIFIIKLTPH